MNDYVTRHYHYAMRETQAASLNVLTAYRRQPSAAGRIALLMTAALLREVTQLSKQRPRPLPILQVDTDGLPVRFSAGA